MPLPKSLSRVSRTGADSGRTIGGIPPCGSPPACAGPRGGSRAAPLWTALSARPGGRHCGGRRPARDTLGPPVDISASSRTCSASPRSRASSIRRRAGHADEPVLVGTIAQTDPEKGLAIVGERGRSAGLRGGQDHTGGARLHSVYPDRVILDRGGKLEALMLPRKFQGGGACADGDDGRPHAQPGTHAGRADPDPGRPEPGGDHRDHRPQPVFANGQQRGYRVYPGRNRQQFSKLGLMPGDLVTAINGTPLDDPARAWKSCSRSTARARSR